MIELSTSQMTQTLKTLYELGIDEAGRGPLAGPVAVGLVLVPPDFDWALLPGVGDSKKVSEKNRERIYKATMKLASTGQLWCRVELGGAELIDKKGIAMVIRELIDKGLSELHAQVHDSHTIPVNWNSIRVLLDGSLAAPAYCVRQETIIKGDAKERTIGLASILAKVTRDSYMYAHGEMPAYASYQFGKHKGYGTALHRRLIAEYGLSDEHRRSYCKNIKVC